jgi:hypothetical protein
MWNNIQMRMIEIEMMGRSINTLDAEGKAVTVNSETKRLASADIKRYTNMMKAQVGAMLLMKAAMFTMIYLTQKYAKDSAIAAPLIGALAGAFMGLAFAINAAYGAAEGGVGLLPAVATGAAAGAVFNTLMSKMMQAGHNIDAPEFAEPVEMATGGRILPQYATGGRMGRGHFPVMVEGGETIIPKTQNMLGGGITLNMGDVYANDAEDFAERVAVALPLALRRQNDIGGF